MNSYFHWNRFDPLDRHLRQSPVHFTSFYIYSNQMVARCSMMYSPGKHYLKTWSLMMMSTDVILLECFLFCFVFAYFFFFWNPFRLSYFLGLPNAQRLFASRLTFRPFLGIGIHVVWCLKAVIENERLVLLPLFTCLKNANLQESNSTHG